NVYLQTSNQPLDNFALGKMKELAGQSEAVANEYGNYLLRKEHGTNIYGMDEWSAEFLQVIEGDLNKEQWESGNGIYVTPMRMYHPQPFS
ncbi:hypothetical protein, partial [Vallitalea maricola]|uniref:hypothetical protein n=1 Tax=Vallitalea maricola TaxID=3074433 RepID=UPI0030DB2C72